ncbi:MAG: pyridoxal phosphate-dependent aminotransferase [Candidatus Dormibacteraeota bacterium]|uniref:Aminotransferase n=1 Tax=Candidatus Aeolococcus gillhamiae TaxID=3127015 RepID=A0A934JRM9_9BACT|nr:pyridoxal phosphate-dependent aminotransferase [Candidatus Dormibacteraeota bacterium]
MTENRISKRVRDMVRMTMADMAELADQRPGAFRLENADAYIPPATHILEATRTAVGDDRHNSYLPLRGLLELREAVAEDLHKAYGLAYDPDSEVVITSGAGEAMLNALLTVTDPGDQVLLTNPTYSGMAQRVRLAGATQRFVDLDEASDWHLPDDDAVRVAGQGADAIFYASPCMPSGTIFTPRETELLADVARTNDAVIIFNASLDKIRFDGRKIVNPATLPGMAERTVTIGSVSKNYNMMGWRIGWVAGPKELVRPMEDVHIFSAIMPNGFAQAGAVAALTGEQRWQDELVSAYATNRDLVVDALRQSPALRVVPAEGGYFLLVNIGAVGIRSPEFARRLLDATGVAVSPMVAWGSDDFGYDHVRIIFTDEPPDRISEACKRIVAFVGSLVKK